MDYDCTLLDIYKINTPFSLFYNDVYSLPIKCPRCFVNIFCPFPKLVCARLEKESSYIILNCYICHTSSFLFKVFYEKTFHLVFNSILV